MFNTIGVHTIRYQHSNIIIIIIIIYHLFVLKIIRTEVKLFTSVDKAITKYTDHSIKTSFPLH